MSDKVTLYSHRQGPSPWKSVTILEELGLPYENVFLEFGKLPGGVESDDFLKRNPAGRVPLLYDPKTGISLSESNAIAKYLVEQYDKSNGLTINTFPGSYLVDQWLNFQGGTQGPFFQQALVVSPLHKNIPDAHVHFQGIVKRTLKTLDTELTGKQYLVGDKCTIADLSFVNWDLTLDLSMKGDKEAATMEQRATLYPNWAAWHQRLLQRPAVQRMIEAQKVAISQA